MCATRVARVVALEGGKARVRFLGSPEVSNVNVSMIEAGKGSYAEVFAGAAIGCVTKKEAEYKRPLRPELLSKATRVASRREPPISRACYFTRSTRFNRTALATARESTGIKLICSRRVSNPSSSVRGECRPRVRSNPAAHGRIFKLRFPSLRIVFRC